MPETQRSPLLKWGAIAVIALMLLSGVAVYFAAQTPTDTTDPTLPGNDPIRTLVSVEVQAKVTDLFPTAIIIGQSNRTDKSEIDSVVGEIDGVTNIQSQFTDLNINTNTVSYLGEITLAADANKDAFIDHIFESGVFVSPEIYFQGVVEIPLEVEAQTESGETETVQFPRNQIPAFVIVSTRVGDIISGPITILMQGEEIRNAYIFESLNVTQSPVPFELQVTAPITELQPHLIGTGIIHFTPSLSEEMLSAGLNALPGIESVENVFIPRRDNVLRIQMASTAGVAEDVNALVQAFPTKYTSFSFNSTTLEVGLGDITIAEAKLELRNVIESTSQTTLELSFADPEFNVFIDMNAGSSSTAAVAQQLNQYFASIDTNHGMQLYQPASVMIAALTLPDFNAPLAIPNETVQVYVLPGHALNESVLITLSGTLVQNEIVEISGLETE